MGKKTTIDWADASWNPVTGCKHNCVYCYAQRIASRFAGFDANEDANRYRYSITGYAGQNIFTVSEPMTRLTKDGEKQTAVYPFGFAPTLHTYKLNEPQTWKEPKDIFVCSMADLFGEFIPDNWIQRVFESCAEAPWHRYFFLTKNPRRYIDLFSKMDKEGKRFPSNYWFGTTVTTPDAEYFFRDDVNCFLSIEPIQSDFPVDDKPLNDLGIKWIIVGAETGNRVGKIKPRREWVEHIEKTCDKNEIPLFMKDSIQDLMKRNFRQEKPLASSN